MDKKFLNRVVNQIFGETTMEYNGDCWVTKFPFSYKPYCYNPNLLNHLFREFSEHCRDVYSLNKDERDYLYKEYLIKLVEWEEIRYNRWKRNS